MLGINPQFTDYSRLTLAQDAQTEGIECSLVGALVVAAVLVGWGLHAIKTKTWRTRYRGRLVITGNLAVYMGYLLCTSGFSFLILGLLCKFFSQQIMPIYEGLLASIVSGLAGGIILIAILWCFRQPSQRK
ncbi:MAG: hypothetical protein AAFX78_07935 [Cyanobacteria bacterium J06638_20]